MKSAGATSNGEPGDGLEYRESEGPISEEHLLSMGQLAQPIFHSTGSLEIAAADVAAQLRMGLNGYRWIHLCLAFLDGKLVGYKVGRSNDPRIFESWNGGVVPEARNRGIASQLARRQEAWCRANGFRFMSTETAHDNRAMLILNLKQGFHIAGTYLNRGANLKVVLEKEIV